LTPTTLSRVSGADGTGRMEG